MYVPFCTVFPILNDRKSDVIRASFLASIKGGEPADQPDLFVNLVSDIAVHKQTRTRERSFKGVWTPTAHKL